MKTLVNKFKEIRGKGRNKGIFNVGAKERRKIMLKIIRRANEEQSAVIKEASKKDPSLLM